MVLATAVLPLLLLQGSGLSSTTLLVGKGPEAKAGDRITVEYHGTLTDGKVFDSSRKKAPFAFVLGKGQVIKGWDQGLIGVKKGQRLRLTIPPALAYGDREIGEIPPNSTLVFVVDILRIDPPTKKPMIEIQEIAPGEGAAVKDGDTVSVHYTGTFLNGTEFDSSRKAGRTPLEFRVGAGMVIPGFDLGVTGMKKGGKRKVTIPPELAYGERGAGGVIPPNSTLQFELEIVEIK